MQCVPTMGRAFSRLLPLVGILVGLFPNQSPAETVFLEAETMQPSSAGWVVTNNDQTQRASRTRTLWGADGPGDAVATKTVRARRGRPVSSLGAIPAGRRVAWSL